MDIKTCIMCKIEKHIKILYEKMQNVKIVIAKKEQNVTLILKIKYQTTE